MTRVGCRTLIGILVILGVITILGMSTDFVQASYPRTITKPPPPPPPTIDIPPTVTPPPGGNAPEPAALIIGLVGGGTLGLFSIYRSLRGKGAVRAPGPGKLGMLK
jgi:hypothetical protein